MDKFNNCVIIYGASAAGKTSIIKLVREELQSIDFLNLDQLAKGEAQRRGIISSEQGVRDCLREVGSDEFLKLGLAGLEHCSSKPSNELAVIDVGAGFLDAENIVDWISTRPSILLTVPPKVGHERSNGYQMNEP